MPRDELADLVDQRDGSQIALALRLSPREQAVAAKYDAVAVWIVAYCLAKHKPEFKAGTLPWNPYKRVVELAIEFVHLGLAVRRCGQRDAPVGMQMVDVRKGKKSVQRRINRCGHRIIAEGARGIHRHHIVFGFNALIAALEGEQFFLIERGKSARFILPRSPPEPLTQITSTFSPVSGSVSMILELVLPPAKLVMRRSDPSRFDR